MKTLADFKRATVIGSSWQAWHHNPNNAEQYLDAGVRRVAEKCTNKVGFFANNTVSYLYYPKAEDFEIDSNGDALIYWPECKTTNIPRRLVLRYRKLS